MCVGRFTVTDTAVFVIVSQAGWAFWTQRDQIRRLVFVHLAIVVAYVPGILLLTEQRGKTEEIATLETFRLTATTYFEYQGRALFGHPFTTASVVPGAIGVALLAVAAGVALAMILVRLIRTWPRRPLRVKPYVVLFLILALATPLGLLFYGAVGSSIYNPRNLSASIPALVLLVAAVITSFPRRVALSTAGLILGAMAIGTVKILTDYQRPPLRQAVHDIDLAARPGDVILTNVAGIPYPPVETYLQHPRKVFSANRSEQAAWGQAARGRSVFVVTTRGELFRGTPALDGPENRFVRREEKVYEGLFPIMVGRYQGELKAHLERREGREVIRWSLGDDIGVSPGAARGFVESMSTNGNMTIKGWATDAAGDAAADWILVFSGKRLVAVARPTTLRPDVAKTYGNEVIVSGFVATGATNGTSQSPVRVFGVVGNRATELTNLGKSDEKD